MTGAKAEPVVNGARLVLEGSGRKIAYSRLRATDARGKELTAGGKVSGCLAKAVFPEINLTGNGVRIPDGDTTPSPADGTDFGSVVLGESPVARIFTIQNSGSASRNLSGMPRVAVSGAHAADFTVTLQRTSPVATNGETTFEVSFARHAGDYPDRRAAEDPD